MLAGATHPGVPVRDRVAPLPVRNPRPIGNPADSVAVVRTATAGADATGHTKVHAAQVNTDDQAGLFQPLS